MKRKGGVAFGMGPRHLGAGYVDPDELFTDEEDGDGHPKKNKTGVRKPLGPGQMAMQGARPVGAGSAGLVTAGLAGSARTRPTNNQLLYKAYFRWNHYGGGFFKATSLLACETDACASVTSAFLQVLQTLHSAEHMRSAGTPHHRSVLQILSTNTRRTKVVELSSGTHRVPEELKKHYLSDGEGGQYSTNLDRNRYGNDDNYLFTVIRYDLEFLGLCPCLVDVEIIDSKAGNQSVIVSAGPDACTCHHKGFPDHGAAPGPASHLEPMAAAPQHLPPQLGPGGVIPQHLGGGQPAVPLGPMGLPMSLMPPLGAQLLHAAPDAAAAAAAAAVAAAAHARAAPTVALPPQMKHSGPGPGAAIAVQPPSATAPRRIGPAPSTRSRESPRPSGSGVSQLFDALVMAATGGQEPSLDKEAAGDGAGGEPPVTSGYHAAPLGDAVGLGGAEPGPQDGGGGDVDGARASGPVRGPQVHHPPMRNKSRLWSAMSFGDMDSLQNALDAFRAEEEIVSQPLTGSAGVPRGGLGGVDVDGAGGGASGDPQLRQRRRKPPRGNSSFLLRAADSLGADITLSKLGIKFEMNPTASRGTDGSLGGVDVEKSGDNAGVLGAGSGGPGQARYMPYDTTATAEGQAPDGQRPEPADSAEEEDDRAEGGDGTSGEGGGGTDDRKASMERGRTRHVPRQASAVNLSTRVSSAEMARLRAELEAVRGENTRLAAQLAKARAGGDGGGDDTRGPSGTPAGQQQQQLAQQLATAQAEISDLREGLRDAEERLSAALAEISRVRQEAALAVAARGAVGLAGLHPLLGAQAQLMHQLAAAAAAAGGAGGPSGLGSQGGAPPPGSDPQGSQLAAGMGLVGGGNPAAAKALMAAALQQQQQQQQQAVAAAAAAAGMLPLHSLGMALQAQQQQQQHQQLQLLAALQVQHAQHAALGLGLQPDLAAAALMAAGLTPGAGGSSVSAGATAGRAVCSGSVGGASASAGTGGGGGAAGGSVHAAGQHPSSSGRAAHVRVHPGAAAPGNGHASSGSAGRAGRGVEPEPAKPSSLTTANGKPASVRQDGTAMGQSTTPPSANGELDSNAGGSLQQEAGGPRAGGTDMDAAVRTPVSVSQRLTAEEGGGNEGPDP